MQLTQSFKLALLGFAAVSSAIPWKPTVANCALDTAMLPTIQQVDHQQLSPPISTPSIVAIGKGTQNYTCATPESIPVSNGAVAQLFDVSCLARSHPLLLDTLPGLLHTLIPSLSKLLAPIGEHFFSDPTTAVFTFNDGRQLVAKKIENVLAPVDAVDWLKLQGQETSVELNQGYRVVTAGGKPPRDCSRVGATVEVPYTAEYWFYD